MIMDLIKFQREKQEVRHRREQRRCETAMFVRVAHWLYENSLCSFRFQLMPVLLGIVPHRFVQVNYTSSTST